jgi:hypothetical protein
MTVTIAAPPEDRCIVEGCGLPRSEHSAIGRGIGHLFASISQRARQRPDPLKEVRHLEKFTPPTTIAKVPPIGERPMKPPAAPLCTICQRPSIQHRGRRDHVFTNPGVKFKSQAAAVKTPKTPTETGAVHGLDAVHRVLSLAAEIRELEESLTEKLNELKELLA